VDLRAVQEPLKEAYREHPESGRITLTARGATNHTPVACSVDLGRAVYEAQAHAGVGGEGTGACSGDLLLGALAACVAEAMGLELNDIAVTVEGDLDLQGTLGLDREAPVGFTDIRVTFAIDAPAATAEQLGALQRKTERYCVVMQTLRTAPPIAIGWEP
jgi:uncharacterized OsmC-like protein